MRKSGPIFAVAVTALCAGAGYGAPLSGVATVSITSDTAASAKNIAFDEARRQIITDSLRQYVNMDQLADAMSGATNSELANLISASGIDGEQLSDTAYSANIRMTLDTDAVKKWLDEKGVQSWIPDNSSAGRFVVLITRSDSMANWIELNRIARDANIEMSAKYIMGNQVTAELPSARRSDFTIAVRDAGWHYSASDGVLRIWK